MSADSKYQAAQTAGADELAFTLFISVCVVTDNQRGRLCSAYAFIILAHKDLKRREM